LQEFNSVRYLSLQIGESAMKRLQFGLLLLAALAATVSRAQDAAEPSVSDISVQAGTGLADSDKAMLEHSRESVRALEDGVKDYLVAFRSSHDTYRWQVGLPLAELGGKSVQLAYDISGRNLMAQWTLAQSRALGEQLNYSAFLSGTGAMNFVVHADF
jgi:hypothetical protein